MSVLTHVSCSKDFNVRTLAPTANGTDSLRGQVSWSTPGGGSLLSADFAGHWSCHNYLSRMINSHYFTRLTNVFW